MTIKKNNLDSFPNKIKNNEIKMENLKKYYNNK